MAQKQAKLDQVKAELSGLVAKREASEEGRLWWQATRLLKDHRQRWETADSGVGEVNNQHGARALMVACTARGCGRYMSKPVDTAVVGGGVSILIVVPEGGAGSGCAGSATVWLSCIFDNSDWTNARAVTRVVGSLHQQLSSAHITWQAASWRVVVARSSSWYAGVRGSQQPRCVQMSNRL